MKLTFLGTRGEIEARTPEHWMHTALLITSQPKRIMIDCGADWAGKLETVNPDAIVLTHGHPDHVGGLRKGTDRPVYATRETWDLIERWPLTKRIVIDRKPFDVGPVGFQAFALEHSVRAPAVGYRITSGGAAVFYAPDVAKICRQRAALSGVRLYIGDGAGLGRPILRNKNGVLIGHASIRMQLDWLRAEHVPAAIFTHCGSGIVAGDPRQVQERFAGLASEAHVQALIARDGLELTFPRRGSRPEFPFLD